MTKSKQATQKKNWVRPSSNPRKKGKTQRSGVSTTIVAQRAFVGSMASSPRLRASGSGMVVVNTESIGTVSSSATVSGFNSLSTPLIPASLPWLSGVASSFSKFRFLRIRVFYLPTVGTTTGGNIALSLLYDTNDLAPSNLSQVISGNRATFGPVWAGQSGFDSSNLFGRCDMIHLDVDVAKFDKKYYQFVTFADYSSFTASVKNAYCPVEILTGMDGVATASLTLGRLYCSYEIELIEPVASAINA